VLLLRISRHHLLQIGGLAAITVIVSAFLAIAMNAWALGLQRLPAGLLRVIADLYVVPLHIVEKVLHDTPFGWFWVILLFVGTLTQNVLLWAFGVTLFYAAQRRRS
jgi:hypothetical protein